MCARKASKQVLSIIAQMQSAGIKPSSVARKAKTPYKTKGPRHLETQYYIAIKKLLTPMYNEIKTILKDNIPAVRKSRNIAFKRDSYPDDIERVFNSIRIVNEINVSTIAAESVTRTYLNRDNEFNKQEMNRQFKSVLGVNPITTEPWLVPVTRKFTIDNVKLIKSIPEKLINDLQFVVSQGITQGVTAKTLAEEIRDKFRIADNRSKLIARDQMNKFYGALTKERNEDVGITHFFWRATQDQRTRDTHAARDGKRYAWKTGVSGELPGSPIQCRCVGESDFSVYTELYNSKALSVAA